MSNNLPNNTTVDNKRIVSESDSNNHRHHTSTIIGLSESAIGDVFIYAEYIDGVSYTDLQSEFISNSNNTMTGTLNVSTTSVNENNIINVFELEALKDSNNIHQYDITPLPSVEESSTTTPSIVVTGSNDYIDQSFIPSSVSNVNSNISISGPEQVSSLSTYEFDITNYNRFHTYTTTVSNGTVSIDEINGKLIYNTPNTAPQSETISLTVTNVTIGVSKDITFELISDGNVTISYFDGTDYQEITTSLTITSNDIVELRIDDYNSNYNYQITYNTSVFDITQNGETILLTPPASNPSSITESITVSRTGSSLSFDVILEEYN